MNADWPLTQTFLQSHPYEAGLVLEKLLPSEAAALLRQVPLSIAAPVLERMTSSIGAQCLLALPADPAAAIIEKLSLDAAARLLRCLSAVDREHLLPAVSAKRSTSLQRLLRYPLGTAGALMDPETLTLPQSLLVSEALERVQRFPQHTLYYLYIVDQEQTLTGVMNLRELMLADRQDRLSSVMHTRVERLSASANLTAILLNHAWREFYALPVTDNEGRFLGALRSKTLRRLELETARKPLDESLTAVLSLGELCWIGFGGMLAGLAAAIFPQALPTPKRENSTYGRND
jgi:magnesium transporter